MANETYLLDVNEIDHTIDIFKNEHTGYSITVDDKEKKKVVTINKNKEKGILNIFFLTGGRVSFQIQSKLKSDCAKLKNLIASNCKIPFPDLKQYETKCDDLNEFDFFLEILKEDKTLNISEKSTDGLGVRNRISITNQSGAVVTVTCFDTKTVTLQGKLTPLFVQIYGLISEDVVNGSFAKEMKLVSSIQNEIPSEIKIEDYIPNIDSLSKKYKMLIVSSIELVNAAIILDDNSGLITSMMRAIEGLMIDKIGSKSIIQVKNSFDYFHMVDNKWKIKPEYDYFPDAENTILEECYTFWNTYRHPYSHIDKYDTQNTRLLTYDKALEIIKIGLNITNKMLTIL